MCRTARSHSVARMRPTRKSTRTALLCAAILATAACTDNDAQTDNAGPSDPPAAEETRVPLKMAGQYKAFLYGPDHTGASGARLTEAWEVLREDRINFHERGVTQADDQSDPVFADPANREKIETMLANGSLTENAARRIVEDNVLVQVDIYTRDDEPERLDVFVY